MGEIDDLKKLPPEERMKKLKEIQERDKKEIENVEKLLKQSVTEIAEEQKIKDQVPVPELKPVDISNLFTEEDEQKFEEQVHELPTVDLYKIQKGYESSADLSQDQQNNLYTVQQELGERRQAMEDGTYKPTDEAVREILSVSEGIQKLYKR